MEKLIPFLIFVILIHTTCAGVFYHDVMSEDDVTFGLPSIRAKRDTWGAQGRLGPLYTHVKTDSGGTFKWGAKHMVGRMFAGDREFDEEYGFQ